MLGHILLLLFLSESYESDLTDDYAVYQAPGGETTLFYCRPDKGECESFCVVKFFFAR